MMTKSSVKPLSGIAQVSFKSLLLILQIQLWVASSNFSTDLEKHKENLIKVQIETEQIKSGKQETKKEELEQVILNQLLKEHQIKKEVMDYTRLTAFMDLAILGIAIYLLLVSFKWVKDREPFGYKEEKKEEGNSPDNS